MKLRQTGWKQRTCIASKITPKRNVDHFEFIMLDVPFTGTEGSTNKSHHVVLQDGIILLVRNETQGFEL